MSAASAGAGPTRDLRVDLDFACTLADAARPIALSRFRAGASIDNKIASGFDPVTEADRGVEAELRRRLAEGRPDDAILGEEAAPLPGRSGRTWVLDPVDGTRAFIAGLPTWCVLIALSGPDGPLLSVVDQPFTEERFSAIAGEGAWLTHKGVRRPIRVSACETVSGAILSTTDPGLFDGAEAEAFDALAGRAKVRRYGLDAYAYAALALGGIDLVVESGLQPWDVAALVPLVTGAGGVITDWRGGPCHDGGRVVAAATAELHADALETLSRV